MADATSCVAGAWVEVRYVLLEPADRAANLPADTAAQPLLVWVKGFAPAAGTVGEELTIETMTGRAVTGVLTEVNPGYTHTFGRPTPELTRVGRDLRARIAAYRAAPKAGE
jgi:2-amino-4-ketopentanoate thiolase alpha subunit